MKAQVLLILTSVALFVDAHSAYSAEADLTDIKAEITKRHDEAVKRLQEYVR